MMFPEWSTTAQNLALGQDTASGYVTVSIVAGVDQLLPLYVRARPLPSTATQNVEDPHDSAYSP